MSDEMEPAKLKANYPLLVLLVLLYSGILGTLCVLSMNNWIARAGLAGGLAFLGGAAFLLLKKKDSFASDSPIKPHVAIPAVLIAAILQALLLIGLCLAMLKIFLIQPDVIYAGETDGMVWGGSVSELGSLNSELTRKALTIVCAAGVLLGILLYICTRKSSPRVLFRRLATAVFLGSMIQLLIIVTVLFLIGEGAKDLVRSVAVDGVIIGLSVMFCSLGPIIGLTAQPKRQDAAATTTGGSESATSFTPSRPRPAWRITVRWAGGLLAVFLIAYGVDRLWNQNHESAPAYMREAANAMYSKRYPEAMAAYRNAAANGNGAAMCYIGGMYRTGLGVPRDNAEAMRWYQKSAATGNLPAMANIGHMYLFGLAVEQNYAEAKKWFQKGADAGDLAAFASLGYMYQKGLGAPPDLAEAERMYRKAAESQGLGCPGDDQAKESARRALREMGKLDSNQSIDPDTFQKGLTAMAAHDYSEAMDCFVKAADSGNIQAPAAIGKMYRDGLGVNADYAEAMKWFKKGSDAGDNYATGRIGWMYDNGLGVAQDAGQALKWYRKAAEGGDPQAMFNLGDMYLSGRGVGPNVSEAAKWIRRSAEGGAPWGIYGLGCLYEQGLGVPKDSDQAVKLYRRTVDEDKLDGAAKRKAEEALARLGH